MYNHAINTVIFSLFVYKLESEEMDCVPESMMGLADGFHAYDWTQF